MKKADKVRNDWEEDCMHFWGKVLVGEKKHWCHEFDGLPIDETCTEFEFCLCFDDSEGR